METYQIYRSGQGVRNDEPVSPILNNLDTALAICSQMNSYVVLGPKFFVRVHESIQ